MQFSAEIAPRDKEGSYIALAILPYFVGKALAGGMAMLSPIGMVGFRKVFKQVEEAAIEEAKQGALEAQEGIEEQG